MKKKRFTPEQIANILKEFDNGKSVLEIVRDHGGMNSDELKKMKSLEEENRRLKHMYAELALDLKLAKEIIEKKL